MEYLFWGMFAGVVTIAAVDLIFAQEKKNRKELLQDDRSNVVFTWIFSCDSCV